MSGELVSLTAFRTARAVKAEARERVRHARWSEVAEHVIWMAARAGEGRRTLEVATEAGLSWDEVIWLCPRHHMLGVFAIGFEDGSVATASGLVRPDTPR